MADVLEHLRDYLVAQNLVRAPRVAAPGGDPDRPPMWLEPREGVPAPGEGQNATERGTNAVLGAYVTGGIPSQPYEAMLRKDTIDVWFRTTTAPRAFALYQALFDALADKRDWDMAGLTVIETLEFRPLQRLGSDQQAFNFVWTLLVERYRADAP